MLNKAMILGNLGADPEIRTFQNGNKCANFSVATTESWKDKATGERKNKTEWHRVSVFGDGLVGICEKYIKKGSKVYVEGKISTRSYETASGETRYTTEIVVQGFGTKILMLGSKQDGSGQDYQAPPTSDNGGQVAEENIQEDDADDFDDEIPF